VRRFGTIPLAVLLVMLPPCAESVAQTAAPANATASQSIEDEVLGNLKSQRIAERTTVDDYQLPDAFLRVVADRVIRSSFEDRYRLVVRDEPGTSSISSATDESGSGQGTRSRAVRWLGLVILVPVAIAGWVLLARRKKAAL
jgi:hypothetical protein